MGLLVGLPCNNAEMVLTKGLQILQPAIMPFEIINLPSEQLTLTLTIVSLFQIG